MKDSDKIGELTVDDLMDRVSDHAKKTVSNVITKWGPIVGGMMVVFLGAVWWLLSSHLSWLKEANKKMVESSYELTKAIHSLDKGLGVLANQVQAHERRIDGLEENVYKKK